jgi:hypothetical protein
MEQMMEERNPIASPNTIPLTIAGIVLCLIAISLFYAPDAKTVIVSLVLFYGGVTCFKGAYEGDKKFAEDMKYRADAHASRLAFWRTDIALENLYEDAKVEGALKRMRQELDMLKMEVERRLIPLEEQTRFMQGYVQQQEVAMRARLIKPAEQQGMSVDQYMQVNEHWNRQLVDLEIRWRDMQHILEGAYQVDMSEQEKDRRLVEYWKQMAKEYHLWSLADYPEQIKEPVRKLYSHIYSKLGVPALNKKLIRIGDELDGEFEGDKEAKKLGSYRKAYEREVDAAHNREKSKRHRSEDSNSRAGYPPTAGDDED